MLRSQDLKKYKLPETPGIYFFKKGKDILYIGKATSLKDRVKSYFSNDILSTRSPLIVDMVFIADKIDYVETDSVLEALILEAELIKKHQPKYNTKEKDNKSFNYVVITEEDYPRVLVERGRNLENNNQLGFKIQEKFGPYTNGTQLKEAVRIVRKIFPFRDRCLPIMVSQQGGDIKNRSIDKEIILGNPSILTTNGLQMKANLRPCFNYQLGLCPGICIGLITKKEYQKTIKNIKLFFEGKKKQILKGLEKEMNIFAKNQQFEKANNIKKTIFALNHIQDIALLKSENLTANSSQLKASFRIEAYDVAHLSGTNNVGVMTVIENGEINKNEYRKFIIRESSGSDTDALREILERRLKHLEWTLPQIIVVDGGKAQINIARKIINKTNCVSYPRIKDDGILGTQYPGCLFGIGIVHQLSKTQRVSGTSQFHCRGIQTSLSDKKIEIVSVLKDEHHKPKAILGTKNITEKYSNDILLANSEAHRFAIRYHREKRSIFTK
jgi:excinuclease ABC subunit C